MPPQISLRLGPPNACPKLAGNGSLQLTINLLGRLGLALDMLYHER